MTPNFMTPKTPDFMGVTANIIAEVRARTCINDVDAEVIKDALNEYYDALNEYYVEEYHNALSSARNSAYDKGYSLGYDVGYEEAYALGYSEGHSEGLR